MFTSNNLTGRHVFGREVIAVLEDDVTLVSSNS